MITRHRKPRAISLAAATIAGIALTTTACSSGAGTSSTSGAVGGAAGATASGSAQSKSFTGTPIKIGIITDVGTAVNFVESAAAARAAVRAVNSSGGINGHEVNLIVCNEALDPNRAQACARDMVSDHVMATAGNTVITAEESADKILANAGIANVGDISFGDYAQVDPNSYVFTPGSDYVNAAMADYVAKNGYKRVGQLLLSSPFTASYVPIIKGVVTSLGGSYVATVTAPQVTADMSTQAAALNTAQPDAVITNASPPASLAVMRDIDSLGYTGKFISDGTQYTESDLDALGPVANQIIFASPFPPLSATQIPGIREFLTDMQAERAAGDQNAPAANQIVETTTMSAWLAVIAIQRIADHAKATDAASFKKAINAAANVNLDGIIPPWTPNKAEAGSAVPRASDGSFYFITWNNGKTSLVSQTPTDVTQLVARFLPR